MKCFSASRWLSTSILILSFFSHRLAASTVSPEPPPPVIVIGFVGGFVHHDNLIHREVQLATHLRRDYPSGVEAKIFENHLGRKAHQEVLRLLDTDRDGVVSAREKLRARVILYGHSWGASEAIVMARTLQQDGVPVLLTVQVDSVSKPSMNDNLIPANVVQAINFYQLDGLLHGQRRILAADPSRTRILGNFQSHYKNAEIDCDGYPWYARLFMKPHIEIESDPGVWNRIESLIRSELPAELAREAPSAR